MMWGVIMLKKFFLKSSNDSNEKSAVSSGFENPLYKELDPEKLPRHVAIIMDGNGRWANNRGLIRTAGHRAGANTLRNVVRMAGDLGIEALTVYAFSTENWKRPHTEVDFLMKLFSEYLAKEFDELHKSNVRIRFIGRTDELPKQLIKEAIAAEEQMKDNTGLRFNVAMNYGGQDEIVRAARKLAQRAVDGDIKPEDISEAMLEDCLDTHGMPPVDLVIRTSGDIRISNFLLWQSAYAEYWFTDVNWPDFTPERFVEALKDFAGRKRRFGGLNKA